MLKNKADVIFYGGDIFTMEDDESVGSGKAEAVAISGQTIMAVGSVDSVFRHKGPNTEVIFLNQQTLMPGFIEPHQHATMCAQTRSEYTSIGGLKSYSEVKSVIESKMKEFANDPKQWGLFMGWDPELISDLPILSAAYLDANYSSVNPMVVIGQSGHVAWVNHAAFDKAGVNNDTPNPSGGTYVKDKDGKLTGQLFEEPAMMGIMQHCPPPDIDDIKNSINEQWMYYASAGFTTVTELGYMPTAVDELLKSIADDTECPIRLGLYRLTNPEKEMGNGSKAITKPYKASQAMCCPCVSPLAYKYRMQAKTSKSNEDGIGNYNSKLWEVGIKLIADGSPHCGTAAVHEPFLKMPLSETLGFPPAPGYGILNWDTDLLFTTIKKYHQKGKQLAIHCHGERASEQALKTYEEVMAQYDSQDNRHRMEHCGLMTVEQIARAGKINLCLSFFVDHLRYYGLVYKTDIYGDRVNRWTPLSEATKSGVIWTIHQDHPTFPGQATPFSNIKTAVTRCTRDDPNTPYGPEYRVSVHEGLKSYTINAAFQLHRDQEIGSIKVGKKADLVVLSENPYEVDPFDLERIKVIETFLDGRRNNLAQKKTLYPGSGADVLYLSN